MEGLRDEIVIRRRKKKEKKLDRQSVLYKAPSSINQSLKHGHFFLIILLLSFSRTYCHSRCFKVCSYIR